jgi:hypothetical protein
MMANAQSWSMTESHSMRVITDGSPAIAMGLLDDLLATRSIVKQIASVESLLPVDVFALKDARSLSEFAPKQLRRGDIHTFGFSHAGPHSSFITLRTDRPESKMLDTLRHEYAHAVIAAQSPEAPAWLDEGLAEFWGAAVVDGDRVVIGRPVAQHIEQLRRRKWLPLKTMLKQRRGSVPSNPETVPLFYAQAWAMVHYLLLGQNAHDDIQFMPSTTALPSQFESAVRQYVADARFREVSRPWQPPASSPRTSSTISEAQALAERANMLVSGEQPHAALQVARQALAINPREPLALEVIGTYHFLSNEPQQARDWLTRALSEGPATYRAALYMSLLSTSPADRERFLTLAVISRPASDVAWQRLGAIYVADGRVDTARRWCREWSTHSLSSLWRAPLMACGS